MRFLVVLIPFRLIVVIISPLIITQAVIQPSLKASLTATMRWSPASIARFIAVIWPVIMAGAVIQALRPDCGLQGKVIVPQVIRMKRRALALGSSRTRNHNIGVYSVNSMLQSHNEMGVGYMKSRVILATGNEEWDSLDGFLLKPAHASLKKIKQRTPLEKLGVIPAFMVTSMEGSPFVHEGREGTAGVLHTSLKDAELSIAELTQDVHMQGKCRITMMAMDKAMELVRGPGRKLGPGRNKLNFCFARCFNAYEDLLKLNHPLYPPKYVKDLFKVIPQPIFHAQGLYIMKGNEEVRPLFFELDDLMECWRDAQRENPTMPELPNLDVIDFLDTFVKMEQLSNDVPGMKGFAFYGDQRAINMAQDLYKKQVGTTSMKAVEMLKFYFGY